MLHTARELPPPAVDEKPWEGLRTNVRALLRRHLKEGYSGLLGQEYCYIRPAPGRYPFQWFWDTCFHILHPPASWRARHRQARPAQPLRHAAGGRLRRPHDLLEAGASQAADRHCAGAPKLGGPAAAHERAGAAAVRRTGTRAYLCGDP